MTGSCFAERLSQLLPLTAGEREALARLEETERSLRRGASVRREGDPATELFVLRSGWMYSYATLPNGGRQILRLHFPGDLVGVSAMAFGVATDSLAALTDVRLCPFEKAALKTLVSAHPRLGALLLLVAQVEYVALTDRLASLGRTSARARVAALLLDTLDRVRAVKPAAGDSFRFPLTQEEIGDATGLTSVHVNRMMRALVEEGLIAREGPSVTILDRPRLAQIANYVNRYAELDLSWLPAAR